jgi:hypothetical protein
LQLKRLKNELRKLSIAMLSTIKPDQNDGAILGDNTNGDHQLGGNKRKGRGNNHKGGKNNKNNKDKDNNNNDKSNNNVGEGKK